MASKTEEKERTDRGELAARMFEAMISGILASGKGLEPDGAPHARLAYSYVDAFLRVRSGDGQK